MSAQDSDGSLRNELDIPDENPWRDEDVIRELYVEREMSLSEVGEVLEGSPSNIGKWVKKHGYDTRDIAEAKRKSGPVTMYVDKYGHVRWSPSPGIAPVHRLLAVAEFGLDAIRGKHIHHKNEIPWDNRPENLELVTHEEHNRRHLKVDPLDRIRVAELYENGDCSYRVVHEQTDYDVSKSTIRAIHKEFYGGEAA